MHHNPCFNLFILHSNSFDNQGSKISKNDIFLRFNILSFPKAFLLLNIIYKGIITQHIYIYKASTLKAIVKIYIQLCSFSKARDIVQKFWVSKTTHKNSLQKYLESGICWKVNACYPAFSCFTGWSCPGIFFIQPHTLIV